VILRKSKDNKMKRLIPVLVFLFLVIILLLAGAGAFYIFGGNWAVSSGFLEDLLSRKPDRFQIEWASGKLSLPGTISLEGLKIRSRTGSRLMLIQADKCTLHIKPLKLLLCRADFEKVEAEGFTLWIRKDNEKEAPNPLAPPIPDSVRNSAKKGGGSLVASPWSLRFGNIGIRDIKEIWIDSYKTTGACSADISASFRLRGAVEVGSAKISLKDAKIMKGKEVIASALGLETEGRIDRFVPAKAKGRAFLRYVSAKCKCKGEVGSLGFLNEAFGQGAPVRFSGNGSLLMDLAIEKGVLGPNSTMSWKGSGLSGSTAGVSVKGDGAISGGTKPDGTTFSLTARWSKIIASMEGIPPIPLEGPGLTAVLSGSKLDMASENDDMAAKLELPESLVRNLSALNGLLPPESPVAFRPGSQARLRGNFELKNSDPRGEVSAEGTKVGVSLKEQSMRGDFYAKLFLCGGDLKAKTFDISGSKFGIRNADIIDSSGQVVGRGWNGEVALSGTSVELAAPAVIKTKARLTISDTRPVIAALIPESKASKWLDPVLDIPDVKGTADIQTNGKETILKNVDLRGLDLRLLADLKIRGERTDGTMTAEFRSLSATVNFHGKEIELKAGGLTMNYDASDPETQEKVDKAVGAAKKGYEILKKRFGKKEK
jgi:hypothetical protein